MHKTNMNVISIGERSFTAFENYFYD